ncbi:glutamyl-tRNA(Gln) amidotransferase subunit A [Alphaproteobacteria bacterium]|nr:glutamyl-tRNA(Gln) amidotransferase subunit A [Alphaproteobacteria bacterium]GHS97609.1 glutamyl-tRNA(Gln) amidotransferase subunit A [Alphaproteobacteria bacterium]
MERDEWRKLSLLEAKRLLDSGQVGALELTNACIEAMEASRNLNIFITETPENARLQAQESEKKLKNKEGGVLEGIPLAIKDLYCTKNVRTTAGSKILENFVPPYESTVTQNLLDAGAVFLGKTNLDEFAMGSANITSFFGPVISPIRSTQNPEKSLVPGGSSGGSVAAVAAHIAFAATASDTGGSIRQPASFTGLVGIKPTYGLCSRYGMVAFASSLDQAGPVAKTVRDAALMLSVMASYDEKDSTSLKGNRPDYLKNLNPSAKKLRIGLPKECFENLSDELKVVLESSCQTLRDLGAEFVDISLSMLKYSLPCYYIIAPAEASSNLARYDGVRYGFRAENVGNIADLYAETRRLGFGKEVRRRIFIGTYVLSQGSYEAYYVMAQKVRSKIRQEFEETFQRVDVILTPTATCGAFGVEEGPKMSAVDMYLNDIFTVSANMVGIPGISIPAGTTQDGRPLGIQFLGARFSEQTLFNVSAAFEDATRLKN